MIIIEGIPIISSRELSVPSEIVKTCFSTSCRTHLKYRITRSFIYCEQRKKKEYRAGKYELLEFAAQSVSKSVSIWGVNTTLGNKIALYLENPGFRALAFLTCTYTTNEWYELNWFMLDDLQFEYSERE